MDSHLRQLIRFGLVGLFNTAVAYGVFALLLRIGVHYALATLLGGVAGMLVGFNSTGRFVFKRTGNGRFLRFLLVFLAMFALNILIQRLLHPAVNRYLAGAAATVACFLVSYTLNRSFVFGARDQGASEAYDGDYARVQIQRSRNPLRRWVRSYYLRDIVRYTEGPSIDVGCGAGDLLARLPEGSMGLEVNAAAVEHCRNRGLCVESFDPVADGYRFESLPSGRFRTMIFTHVLEHLEDPAGVLYATFIACGRLGIDRVVLTLPCVRGFRFDPTHRTFVDLEYLNQNRLLEHPDFVPRVVKFFPLDWKWVGRYYTFHELRVVFEQRRPGAGRAPNA